MIIVDFSQIFMTSLFTQNPKEFSAGKCDNILRHIILNSIRQVRKKFSRDGQVVIACEGANSWRKQVFPHYKAARKALRSESPYDSERLFSLMKFIQTELRDNFPYRVLSVYEAEADDIIGVLTMHFHREESIVIVSRDKDFIQLDRYKNVKRYDPIKKLMMKTDNSDELLLNHIISGDVSDGIPNIFSSADSFVKKTRQVPVTKKKLYESQITMMSDLERFLENKALIDLREIPLYIQELILNEYEMAVVQENRSKVLGYLLQHKLLNLVDDVQDF